MVIISICVQVTRNTLSTGQQIFFKKSLTGAEGVKEQGSEIQCPTPCSESDIISE